MSEYFENARRMIYSSYDTLTKAITIAGALAISAGQEVMDNISHMSESEVHADSPETLPLVGQLPNLAPVQLVSVVCGFPKDLVTYPVYSKGQFGEDAWFKSSTPEADVLGVADGVGGWSAYGIDPGQFSDFLMRSCERFTHSQDFEITRPELLLTRAYYNLLEQKQPVLGSCTACVLILHRESGILFVANIGDSGLLVIRDGVIVCRSVEQQHFFNTPYQLTVPPPGENLNVLSDEPECAALLQFEVQAGDILMLATDGVYDNLSEKQLLQVLSEAAGITDPVKLQMYANTVALMARILSFSPNHDSPFSQNARRHNIDAPGGKPDDITVVLSSVI